MAKKDKNSIPFLLIGLVGVFFALIIALVVYNIVSVQYDYNDEQFNQIEEWVTFRLLEMPEDEYILLYNYDEFCAACNQLKQDVLKFANSNNNDIVMYFADVRKQSLSENAFLNPAPTESIPHMALLYNGQIVVQRTGVSNILDLLKAIDNGEYIS